MSVGLTKSSSRCCLFLFLQLSVGCLAFSSPRETFSLGRTARLHAPTPSSSSSSLLPQALRRGQLPLKGTPNGSDPSAEFSETNREELLKYLNSDLSISFQEYQIQQTKLKYLADCPIFVNQSPGDRQRLCDAMELVQFAQGETVVQQGLTGDAMYFVIEGELECIDEDNDNELLTMYEKEGQYFGEVSLLFGEPRMASIRAVEDCKLYRLDKKAFLDSMVDTKVYDTARDMILKKYTSSRIRDVILKLSSGEIMDLLRAKLQPQKQYVSVENRLRLFAWGAASSLMFGILSPGWDAKGWPNLFNVMTNPLPNGSAFLTSSLFATLSFVTTSSDTKIGTSSFTKKFSIEWLSLGFWLVGLSNLTGKTTDYLWDAWGFPRFFLTLSLVGSVRNSIATILSMSRQDENVEVENKDDEQEEQQVETSNSTANVILTATILGLANVVLLVMASPIFSSLEQFQKKALPSLAAAPGLVQYLCIASQILLSFFSPGASRGWVALAVPWVAFDATKFGLQAAWSSLTGGRKRLASSKYIAYLITSLKTTTQWQVVLPTMIVAWFVGGKIQSMRVKTSSKTTTATDKIEAVANNDQ